jgi:ribonuclease inhibitor
MKKIIIDGKTIKTASEIYQLLNKELDFGSYFGSNLDALWDVLTSDVERPFEIRWINSEITAVQNKFSE